jgi:hypothetical protein
VHAEVELPRHRRGSTKAGVPLRQRADGTATCDWLASRPVAQARASQAALQVKK